MSSKVQTSYIDEDWLQRRDGDAKSAMPFVVEGIDLDLRMRNFEFFKLISPFPFDSPKPMHLKATGKIKFQGKVLKPCTIPNGQDFGFESNIPVEIKDKGKADSLVGEVLISGLKLNQLMLAPQLAGSLSMSRECIKVMESIFMPFAPHFSWN